MSEENFLTAASVSVQRAVASAAAALRPDQWNEWRIADADETPEFPPIQRVAGRCATHDDLAWRFDDGSIVCMWRQTNGTLPTDCEFATMPTDWLIGTALPRVNGKRHKIIPVSYEQFVETYVPDMHKPHYLPGPDSPVPRLHAAAIKSYLADRRGQRVWTIRAGSGKSTLVGWLRAAERDRGFENKI